MLKLLYSFKDKKKRITLESLQVDYKPVDFDQKFDEAVRRTQEDFLVKDVVKLLLELENPEAYRQTQEASKLLESISCNTSTTESEKTSLAAEVKNRFPEAYWSYALSRDREYIIYPNHLNKLAKAIVAKEFSF